MSVVNTILCLFIGILTIIFIFNAIATVGAGLLGMAIGLLQLIVILPWILLEKITGIEPPAWAHLHFSKRSIRKENPDQVPRFLDPMAENKFSIS